VARGLKLGVVILVTLIIAVLVLMVILDLSSRPKVDSAVIPPPPPPIPAKEIVVDPGGLNLKLVRIEPGKFTMGSTDKQIDKLINMYQSSSRKDFEEEKAHEGTIDTSFYLGAYEVTIGQFRRFVEANPSFVSDAQRSSRHLRTIRRENTISQPGKWDITWNSYSDTLHDDHPVDQVSWNDAQAFVDWLNNTDRQGLRFSLPTERQWEYACRAGTDTIFPYGDNINMMKLAEIGNFADARFDRMKGDALTKKADDGHASTAPVTWEGYRPNRFGLFNMIGNVWEWCEDEDDSNVWAQVDADMRGEIVTWPRVLRGGGCHSEPRDCRPAVRTSSSLNDRSFPHGFRVAAFPK
jgi:formylglycine-generating enzyme required for sulfatase activity